MLPPEIIICICGKCKSYGNLVHLKLLFIFGLYCRGGYVDYFTNTCHNLSYMYRFFNVQEQISLTEAVSTDNFICVRCETVYNRRNCPIHTRGYNKKGRPVTQYFRQLTADEYPSGIIHYDNPIGIRFIIGNTDKMLVRRLPKEYRFCVTTDSEVSRKINPTYGCFDTTTII
jgi:hypothetical protein